MSRKYKKRIGGGMTGKKHFLKSKKIMRYAHLGIKTRPHSEKTKEKIRKARKLYFQNGGKSHIGQWNMEHTGKKHYWYGKKLSEITKLKMTEHALKRFSNKENHPLWGTHRSEKTKQKIRDSHLGEKCWNWLGGISFEPYSLDWTKTLKLSIRQRDNFTCQKCGITEEECLKKFNRILSVNHIDFNKKNCDPKNLNTLCCRCNSSVNFNREYWTNYFNNKLEQIIT
ncbi:MAG: NUMOD3 domain-containing DNA-binding protein [Nanoarchaeota archaeon]